MIEFIDFKNKDSADLIKDVFLYPLKINSDESGVLVETLRIDWKEIYGKKREFFMQYYSVTPPGTARDEDVWHYHPTVQDDRFIVVQGATVVAIADNREESPTKGLLNLFHMQSDIDPYILLIPKKTLHGFLVVSQKPAILLNFPTALYNPEEEERLPFDRAGIKFPDDTFFNWDIIRKLFNTNE
ncbi:MAG: dTDP-4-dehydrorhamnose 3,5-epimerase family protein [Candidatus Levybacteria bacterium]|nr:dTDP-4-dehydrorhamnose 3,5-epimerase family protein [Candidatus Levybacteria bacterium]